MAVHVSSLNLQTKGCVRRLLGSAILAGTIVCMWLLLASPFCRQARADQKDAFRKRLEDNAIPAWKNMEQSMAFMSGTMDSTGHLHMAQPNKQDIVRHRIIRYYFSRGTRGKVVTDKYDPMGNRIAPEHVICYNPEYAFEAEWRDGKGAYVITSHSNDAKLVDYAKRFGSIYSSWMAFPFAGSHYHPALADLIVDPNCQITSCTDQDVQGEKLVKVELTFAPKTTAEISRLDSTTKQITLLLEPSAHWRVLSDTITSPTIGVRNITATYADASAEPMRLSMIEESDENPNAEVSIDVIDWAFSSVSFAPIDDIEFTSASLNHPQLRPPTGPAGASTRP